MGDLIGSVALLIYYLVIVVSVPTLFKILGAPTEVVRKLQHVGYAMSIFLMLRLFSAWYYALLGAGLLVALAYPVLKMFEGSKVYSLMLVDRTKQGGELRMQLLLVQLTFAALIVLFWGLHGVRFRYLAAVAVMAWGFGDAAAALVGKYFGRHHVNNRFVDEAKTFEGSGAMLITAVAAVFLTMYYYGGSSLLSSLIVALVAAPVASLTELFSRRGIDTVTVPLAVSLVILPTVFICVRLGL